jgi:hypothetical protein
VFAGIVAPSVFGFAFGEEWRRAGTLVSWMTPWFILQFVVVPISVAPHVTGHLRAAMGLQLGGLFVRVTTVAGAAALALPLAEAYAVSGFLFYLLYLVVVLRIVGARASDLLAPSRAGLPIVTAWAVAGVVTATLAGAVIAAARGAFIR